MMFRRALIIAPLVVIAALSASVSITAAQRPDMPVGDPAPISSITVIPSPCGKNVIEAVEGGGTVFPAPSGTPRVASQPDDPAAFLTITCDDHSRHWLKLIIPETGATSTTGAAGATGADVPTGSH